MIGGLGSVFALAVEGRVGPGTLTMFALTGAGAVAASVVPTLYGTDAHGVPRCSTGLRLGVPGSIVLVTVLALAVAASGSSSPERLAVTSGSADDHEDGAHQRAATAPVPSTEPAAHEAVAPAPGPTSAPDAPPPAPTPVVARWDTVGNPFADQTCADGGLFGGDHSHGHVQKQPLDQATQTAVDTQLDVARAAALRYPTVGAAEAAGYRLTTWDLPCIAAHYVRWDVTVDDLGAVDGVFDPADPEILLYDGTLPGSPLVGASYLVVSATEPEGFAGGNDGWHRHPWMCLTDGVVVGVGIPASACAGSNQRWFSGHDVWMAHAWVVPGYENPLGVFADGHARLL